mmetsp:Transcript_103282/g.267364  ORF Transcript_103282/g.267364 Transcript_103282/m.267364 type:complete len:89 (+) Transcript_103282:148-414(+)
MATTRPRSGTNWTYAGSMLSPGVKGGSGDGEEDDDEGEVEEQEEEGGPTDTGAHRGEPRRGGCKGSAAIAGSRASVSRVFTPPKYVAR